MAVLAGVLALSGAVLIVLSPFLAGSKLVVVFRTCQFASAIAVGGRPTERERAPVGRGRPSLDWR